MGLSAGLIRPLRLARLAQRLRLLVAITDCRLACAVTRGGHAMRRGRPIRWWRTDEAGNVMPLPATAEDQQKLKERGIDRPTHRGAHPQWNDKVIEGLEGIRTDLIRSPLVKGSDAYNAKAWQMLERLRDRLRIEMLEKSRIGAMPAGTDGSYA